MNIINDMSKDRNLNRLLICSIGVFLVNVLLSHATSDSNLSNNIMNVSVDIVETQTPSFSFVHYAEDISDNVNNYDALVEAQANFTSKVYPISDETPFFVREENDFIEINGGNINKTCDLIKDLEKKVRASSMNTGKVIGIISETSANKYANDAAGFACRGTSRQAVIVTEETWSGDNKETSGAHEVGHTFDLCDEYNATEFKKRDNNKTAASGFGCPNADKNEDGSLDFECIDTYGISGLKGCPIESQDLIIDLYFNGRGVDYLVNMYGSRPTKTSNKSRWVNNQTYSHLLSELQGEGEVICTDEELIIITGVINKSFSTNLDNFYIVKGGCYINETVGSVPVGTTVLRVEQKGIGDVILNFLSRIIDFFITSDSGELIEIDEMPFVFVMPFDDAITFDFINQSNNVSLAQRNVTPNSPVVNITYPLGGEIIENKFNITWNATDADGGNIYYAVLISNDNGSNYTTLDIDLNQTYYELDPNDYNQSRDYVINILATDGINTGNNITNTFNFGVVSLNITSLQTLYSDGTYRIFEFIILNDGDTAITDTYWRFDPGDGNIINSTINITSIAANEEVFVYIEYNYSTAGNYVVNANATGISDSTIVTASLASSVTINSTDVNKFYFINSSGTKVAWFGDEGNIVLKGMLEQTSNYQEQPNDLFAMEQNGNVFIVIAQNGSIYIDGTLTENYQGTLTSPESVNNLGIYRSNGNLVGLVNTSGYMFLKGSLIENGNP